nr:winged helix-turn-helix transcriptional regulator [Bacillus pacificus]
MFDSTDFKIIKLLQENARMNWKEIGERVHLTGQAVGKRINKLEEAGVIQKY